MQRPGSISPPLLAVMIFFLIFALGVLVYPYLSNAGQFGIQLRSSVSVNVDTKDHYTVSQKNIALLTQCLNTNRNQLSFYNEEIKSTVTAKLQNGLIIELKKTTGLLTTIEDQLLNGKATMKMYAADGGVIMVIFNESAYLAYKRHAGIVLEHCGSRWVED